MSKVKIPKQLFVVRQKGGTVMQPALGFLHDYNPNTSGGQKKMETQLNWAYYAGGLTSVVEENGMWFRRGKNWTYPMINGKQTPTQTPFNEMIDPVDAPQVWDNVPMLGFKVRSTTTRYSTSNKLWRIEDPRGVLFEVTTHNFENILMNSVIDKGEIMSPCVWVGNKNLILAD